MSYLNKILLVFAVISLGSGISMSQTKTVENIEKEIANLENPQSFDVNYNNRKDITTLKLTIDLRGESKVLRKRFKELFLETNAIYSGTGIDNKPFRNLLCVKTKAKQFYFSNDRNLRILLSEDSLNLPNGNRSTKVRGRKIRETICWDINRELIKDLSKSPKMNLGIGSLNISLSEMQLKLFGDYLRLLNVKKS